MALTKQGEFNDKVTNLPDVPSPTYTATQIKNTIQQPSEDLKTTLNKVVDDLTANTGATQVGAKKSDGTTTTVQGAIDEKATNTRVGNAETRLTNNEDYITNLQTNKLDITGDLKGTWHGYTPTQTDPGIQSVVDQHTSQLADIEKQSGWISPTQAKYGAKLDGVTDDSLAFQNAINDLPVNGTLFIPQGTDLPLILTTLTLKSNIRIISLGGGFKNTFTTPKTILKGNNLSNIVLKGLKIDGGANGAPNDINSIRTVQFINCSNILVQDCEVSHGYDWQLSFEQCTDCHVRNHKSYGMGDGFPGGRDGVHFLDCVNCSLDGAYIESGDDCVASTTQTLASSNVTIKNVRGKSQIGSMVVIGQESGSTYNHDNIFIDHILGLGTSRYVVAVTGLPTNINGSVNLSNIKGVSTNHGIFVNSTNSVKLFGGIDVESTTQHGLDLSHLGTVTVGEGVTGKADTQNFDGIHVEYTTNAILNGCEGKESGLWGIHIFSCTNILLNNVRAIDNGELSFASNTGGACRIYNGTNVRIIGGMFTGENTTSYWGILLNGTITSIRIAHPFISAANDISDSTNLIA